MADVDNEWVRHRFAPGEEPAVYTADLCADAEHERKGIDKTIEGYEGNAVFCICLCHRVVKGDPN